VTEARGSRRRRSVARSPALVDPADIPDDAAGRVALIAVRAPDDSVGPGDAAAADQAGRPLAWMAELLNAWGGWLVVALLAAALLVVFVIGLAFTR